MKKIYALSKKLSMLIALIHAIVLSIPVQAQWIQTKGPSTNLTNVKMADNSGMFIAGTNHGGIFVSQDSGQTWMQSVTGIADRSMTVNFMDTLGQSIFIFNNWPISNGVYESNDHAQTWISHPINISYCTGMVCLNSRIFVGSNGQGIFYSDNMGVSWDTLNTYPFFHTPYVAVNTISRLGNDLFVSVTDSGLYKSSDNGSSWIRTNGGLNITSSIGKMASTGTALWLLSNYNLDLYKSTDAGLNWTIVPNPGGSNLINDLYGLNGSLYVMTTPHIFKTANDGASFTTFSGNVDTEYHHLANNGSVFVSSCNYSSVGIQRSTNDGLSWTLGNEGFANSRVTALFADGNNLFASTYDKDMFITADAGMNYTPIPNPNVAFDAFYARDIIRVGTDIVEGGYSKMFRSNNNGANWVNCSAGIQGLYDVNQFMLDGNDLYAATTIGIYKSTSFGNWVSLNTAALAGCEFSSVVKSGNRIFICGKNTNYDAKVFYSEDSGATWTDISTSFGFGQYTNGDRMIVAGGTILLSAGGHLYTSTDNGNVWNMSNGIPFTYSPINTFYLDGTTLYASMEFANEIFVSYDNGANWASIIDNLYNANVKSIAVLNGDIYVGTTGGGVWKRPLSSITVNLPKVQSDQNWFTMYPNPAQDVITITKPNGLNAQLSISTITGDVIYKNTLHTSSLEIDTKTFPNGVYLVQMYDGKNSSTKKLVICK